eukprot:360604-Chlamydomonas_euryale.AAC.1
MVGGVINKWMAGWMHWWGGVWMEACMMAGQSVSGHWPGFGGHRRTSSGLQNCCATASILYRLDFISHPTPPRRAPPPPLRHAFSASEADEVGCALRGVQPESRLLAAPPPFQPPPPLRRARALLTSPKFVSSPNTQRTAMPPASSTLMRSSSLPRVMICVHGNGWAAFA